MNFQMIGSLYSSMKMAEMGMKWQMRKKNPYLPKEGEEDPQVKQLREDAANVRRINAISSIDCKLKAGEELTPEELSFLKENCPELYQEAMELKQERQNYEKALKTCKTKEDVQKLKLSRMQNCLAQAKAIMNNPAIPQGAKCGQMEKILRRVMTIQKTHIRFVKSSDYKNLPTQEEVREEQKAKQELREAVFKGGEKTEEAGKEEETPSNGETLPPEESEQPLPPGETEESREAESSLPQDSDAAKALMALFKAAIPSFAEKPVPSRVIVERKAEIYAAQGKPAAVQIQFPEKETPIKKGRGRV